jgi:hypothetical protein
LTVFDEVIFDEVITLMDAFDVVMVHKFFDVLFGFRRSDFCSSDLFPYFLCSILLLQVRAVKIGRLLSSQDNLSGSNGQKQRLRSFESSR